MENTEEVQYKAWQDRGNNIGIQCLKCLRTHWNDELPVVDPTTGEVCTDCVAIKDQKILQKENDLHSDELEVNDCEHPFSQPIQDGV